MSEQGTPTFFQRYLLPGFAFQAVVIGGGYATGRELVQFFLPSGPWGGLLAQLGSRAFELLYQIMIFGAIVETGVGMIHALNERVAGTLAARNRPFSRAARGLLALLLLFLALVVANRLGLIALIAKGYGTITYFVLAVYVLPMLTVGAWRLYAAGWKLQRA